jgi:predicted aspartyl protease
LGREQDSLVLSIQLAKNGLSIATKALMDTGANGYAFMDIFLAVKLA